MEGGARYRIHSSVILVVFLTVKNDQKTLKILAKRSTLKKYMMNCARILILYSNKTLFFVWYFVLKCIVSVSNNKKYLLRKEELSLGNGGDRGVYRSLSREG